MTIKIPVDILSTTEIENDIALDNNCTHPAGHCYGSDGGSGIPKDLKVPPGGGGEVEVWKLDDTNTKLLNIFIYNKCQYCGKKQFAYEKK